MGPKNKYIALSIILFAITSVALLFSVRAASPMFGAEFEGFDIVGDQNGGAVAQDPGASRGTYFKTVKPFKYYIDRADKGRLSNELNLASGAIWDGWPDGFDADGGDKYQVRLRVPTVSSASDSNFFWASQASFAGDQKGFAYVGLQTHLNIASGNQPKGLIFSMWETNTAVAASGGIARPFDGEGVGMQIMKPFNWQFATEYDLIIERDAARSDSQFLWWKAYVKDVVSGETIDIGSGRYPASYGYLVSQPTFMERYGLSNFCGQFEIAAGEFSNVRAWRNGTENKPSNVVIQLREYTECVDVMTESQIGEGYRINFNPGVPR